MRKHNRRREHLSPTSEPRDERIQELKDVSAFRAAVAAGLPVVNVDLPTHTERLHPRPAECSGVTEHFIVRKVIQNGGRTGRYYAVHDEDAATARWRGLVTCRLCG